ncbi:MAG: Gfo/Idh/MocA family oxidoreductase [Planctomycetales bacterium]|nr:Gfo/Idh/MocA family oxidoreductase [Planctomycetales bacterium]
MGSLRNGASRRDFLKTSAAVGVGFWAAGGVAARASTSPNEQLQIASFGVNGKGRSDVKNASRFGKIFAVCDVDRTFLDQSAKVYKTDHKYTDFRELLDCLGDQIDVCTVSTPDHTHAVIAGKAMKMGKHVYCQKPLTKTIWEARELQRIAKEADVVTQMGNQFTAFEPMRQAAYQIRAGQLGKVSEVHVWTNRPIWPQGEARPEPKPIPNELNWEAWLGPAPYRPYGEGYHTFKWRGWWDFGTGALGDMACHTTNLPFMALNMRDPVSVEAETSGHNQDSYPEWSKIKFEFPELDGRAPFTLYWYDGTKLPPEELYSQFLQGAGSDGQSKKLNASGCLIVGDKATMYAAGDYAEAGIELNTDDPWLEVDYPKPPGAPELGHVEEFYNGIHDRSKKPVSNIVDYSGPLTETILLGNLAVWQPGKVEWDAATITPADASLMKVVKPEYRYGYEL